MEKDNQIFGIRAIIEAINAKKEIDKVFVQKDAQGDLMQDLMKTMKRNNINFSYVPVEKLNRLTPNNHQGAVATIAPISFVALETMVESVIESGKKPLFLILDQLSDARNFGAIIRTAECTGVDGIIIQKQGSAPVNGDTVKTSAGAVFNVPICKVDHIKDAIFYLQGSDIKTVAATEKTEYRIVYNDDYLYVGITCYDSEPDNLTRLAMERDFSLGDDDGTGVIIDTYHDKTTGLGFVANTLDARWDATFTQDGTSSNDSYNTYWDAVTAITDFGYTTEYRIPFSSLRFETKDEVVMGIRIARLIKRKNELITSPPCDPKTNSVWSNLSFAREVIFTNLVSRKPFYISPYVIANYNSFS